MKTRLIKFIAMLVFVALIGVFAIGYYEINKFQSSLLESKAIIAQSLPQIEIARGQRAINNAVAYQIVAVTTNQFLLSVFPYAGFALYIMYKLIIQKKQNNETVQDSRTIVYTTTNNNTR